MDTGFSPGQEVKAIVPRSPAKGADRRFTDSHSRFHVMRDIIMTARRRHADQNLEIPKPDFSTSEGSWFWDGGSE
ncbi:uncharacterized protein H6S33_004501 [Morchella sextelata]|uniref:uncharacterized protein n=1 Tax=Morchella sextelata TaxID=1174677 RepID=UPI001D058D86|nr:uncharacterized protein H6S33_004501 [Morchella sextelata]KAH0606044.1 hypothetical protein H6S33_004501 [Morchella sextelata]